MTENSKTLFKKRSAEAMQYLVEQSHSGKPIVGAYCCYAPVELVYAIDGIPVGLCGTANEPIAVAEKILPANTCPIVKSSFGFIYSGSCPFFELADAIIAETTCDAKKKMFELISERKPFHLMELPQAPERDGAKEHWYKEMVLIQKFLEKQFNTKITKESLESAIRKTNLRRILKREIFEFAKTIPPVVSGLDINRLLDVYAGGEEYDTHLKKIIEKLKKKKEEKIYCTTEDTPRVLLTGCPIGGDAVKIVEEIEASGGVIVIHESCSGIKPLMDDIEEGTDDPLRAIEERYLKLPCSVMTPNEKRFELIDLLVEQFKPDCVIDAILTACHTYSVESYRIQQHVKEKHDLPFLKIETGFSESDRAQLRMRFETLMEIVRNKKK